VCCVVALNADGSASQLAFEFVFQIASTIDHTRLADVFFDLLL
jgi:hypothetical protein